MKPSDNKICDICDKEFLTWQARTGHMSRHSSASEIKSCSWCDKKFKYSNLSTHIKACIKNPNNYIECLECNTQLTKLGIKFCNHSCSASYNNRKYPRWESLKQTTNCLGCNKTITYILGHPLSTNPKPKKYCSIQCQQDFLREQRYITIETVGVEALSPHEPSQRSYLKGYLIDKYNAKCMGCGWCEINKFTDRIPIEIDHIDGNPHNQELSNLQLLCPSCHSLTEFYGSRGKGRKVELGGLKRKPYIRVTN